MGAHIVTEAAALDSAWSVARRICEKELAPEGYAALGLEGVELLEAEARASGYPLVAALVAAGSLFQSGDPASRAERPPVLSPWRDRFLSAETTCRAAIAIELERLIDVPDEEKLAKLARAQERPALATLLEEGLNLNSPLAGDALGL